MMMNCWCCFYVFYGCLITQLKEHKCQLNKAEEIIYMLRGMEDIFCVFRVASVGAFNIMEI